MIYVVYRFGFSRKCEKIVVDSCSIKSSELRFKSVDSRICLMKKPVFGVSNQI